MKYFECRKKFIKLNIDNLFCAYCGDKVTEYFTGNCTRADRLTIDHIKPMGLGGDPFDLENFRICCGGCNSARGRIQCYFDPEKKYARLLKYIKGKKVAFPDEFFHYIFFSPLPPK
jgi:5-methylcytosine-specific restriction endonuclease McrA